MRAGCEIGGPRPRALLALLLLDAGRVVNTDRLIDALYGEEPPGDATNALQAQVSRLRRRLGVTIEREPTGYRLAIDPDDVDVHRFAREGRQSLHAGAPGEAVTLLREAPHPRRPHPPPLTRVPRSGPASPTFPPCEFHIPDADCRGSRPPAHPAAAPGPAPRPLW